MRINNIPLQVNIEDISALPQHLIWSPSRRSFIVNQHPGRRRCEFRLRAKKLKASAIDDEFHFQRPRALKYLEEGVLDANPVGKRKKRSRGNKSETSSS